MSFPEKERDLFDSNHWKKDWYFARKLFLKGFFGSLALWAESCSSEPTATDVPASTPSPPVFPTDNSAEIATATEKVIEVSDGGAVDPETGQLREVPREDTLILGRGHTSVGVTNPWAVCSGYTHQEGINMMWESLAHLAHYPAQTLGG